MKRRILDFLFTEVGITNAILRIFDVMLSSSGDIKHMILKDISSAIQDPLHMLALKKDISQRAFVMMIPNTVQIPHMMNTDFYGTTII